MKKILYICTVLLCLLLAYIIAFTFAIKDTVAWDNFGQNGNGLPMYLNQVEIPDIDAFQKEIIKAAQSCQVNILMSGVDSVDGKEILWKGIFTSRPASWEVELNDGKTVIFSSEQSPFLYETGTSAGQIRDAFRDDHVIFLDLPSAIDKYGASHEYFIEGSSATVFIQQVADLLGTDSQSLNTQTSFHVRGQHSTLSYIFMLSMLILTFLYIIVLLAYLSDHQRLIVILCLHGYSLTAVEASSVRGVLLIFLVCTLVSSTVISFFGSSLRLFFCLFLSELALLLLLLVVYAIAFRAGIHQSLQTLLKGKKPSKVLYLISQVTLCLFSILFVYTIFVEGSSIGEFRYVLQQEKLWAPYQDLGVLTESSIGDNLNSLKGGHNDALLEQRALFDQLWQNGAVYFSSALRQGAKNGTRAYPFIVINQHYLDRFPLSGVTVSSKDAEKPLLILPQNVYNAAEQAEILQIASDYFAEEIHAESVYPYLHPNEKQTPTLPESIPLEFYSQEAVWRLDRSSDPKELVQLIDDTHLTSDGWIKDAVFLKIPLSALASSSKSVMAIAGTRSKLKCSSGWYQNGYAEDELEHLLDACGLSDNHYIFRRLGDYQKNLEEGKRMWIQISLLLMASVFILCVGSSAIVQRMRIILNSKQLALEYLHGYHFMDSHGASLLPVIIVMLSAYPIFQFSIPESGSHYVFPLLLAMALLYFATGLLSSYSISHSVLSARLKGKAS